MERETKEVEIGKHKVVLKTYITGREFNAIQDIYLSSAKLDMVGKDMKSTFDASIQTKATEKTIEMVVVSVDGNTKVLDAVLDLPVNEYDQVIKAIESVTDKKKE